MKYNKDIESHELIASFLAGELRGQYLDDFYHRLENEENFAKQYDEFAIIWSAKNTSNFDTDKAWNKVSSQIFNKTHSTSKKIFFNRHRITAIAAAIILLGVLSVVFIFESKKSEYQQHFVSVIAENTSIEETLTDGTHVSLNTNSVLSYPTSFDDDTIRKVKLEGEAYFEVTSNPEKPFIVETEHSFVRVLGTHFNVKETDSDKYIEVSVLEGLVNVSSKSKDISTNVSAGETCIFNIETETFEVIEANENVLYWKTKSLSFSNQKLTEVCAVLEDNFNYKVQIEDSSLNNLYLTAKFKEDSIDKIIEIIALSLGIEYQKDSSTISFTNR